MIIKVPVCKTCGYSVDTIGCSYECEEDGLDRSVYNTFVKVYERIDTFLRSEEYNSLENLVQ